tara:strand:+ start:669 stop:1130 length:462 start_codon:yes stop_codon:yes gene_type:complete
MRKVASAIKRIVIEEDLKITDRRSYTSLVVSRALAYALPLPTSPVEALVQHYNSGNRAIVSDFVSALNEEMVLDVDAVEALTFKIWRMRYNLVFAADTLDTATIVNIAFGDAVGAVPPLLEKAAQEMDASRSSYVVSLVANQMGCHINGKAEG